MKINHQPLTRGHKTLGAKWLFEPRFSHQSSLCLDTEVAPKSPTFHTANRWRSLTKRAEDRNYNNFEWNIKSD